MNDHTGSNNGHKKFKILFVGPKMSGKSTLVRLLTCDTCNIEHETYDPTVGCRIIEASLNGIDLELWDCSGDQSYDSCWPAFLQGLNDTDEVADGICLCYDVEEPEQKEEVNLWYEYFVKNAEISDYRCSIFAIQSSGKDCKELHECTFDKPKSLGACAFNPVSFSSPQKIRNKFSIFLTTIAKDDGFAF